jgi:hypothetical protein
VQDQRHTDLRAEMLRVGGDGAQRFCGDFKQQVVEHRLVGVGDGTVSFPAVIGHLHQLSSLLSLAAVGAR